MSARFSSHFLDEEDYPRWERFVQDAPGGSVYALPAYLRALGEATGADWRILAVTRGNEIVAGVALYERECWAGRYVAPRLLLYYNGPVFARSTSRYPSERTSFYLHAVSALKSALSAQGFAHLRLHPREDLHDVRPFVASGWQVRPSFSYVIALDDLEAARERVEGNFRRLIRRCEDDGMVLSQDDDFDSFFALHEEIHRRKGVPLYLPRVQYRRFWEELRGNSLARLYHARRADGRAVASQLVLAGPHPITHTVCAGASEDHLHRGASVFLRWKACEALAKDGYAGNDLTDAELNPVTRFKSQLGGELKLSFVLTAPERPAWRVRAAWERAAFFARRARRAARRRLGRPKPPADAADRNATSPRNGGSD